MTDITNDTATTRSLSGNTICDVSGFKAYPGELVQDPYTKLWVLPRFKNDPQREPRAFRSTSGQGPKRAEQDDIFITATVTVDDL